MIKQLSIMQLALGVLLLVPPAVFLCHTRPLLNKVVNQSTTNIGPIVIRMNNLANGMINTSSNLTTIGNKSMEVASLFSKIPLFADPVVTSLRIIGGSCTNLATTMLESASGLRSSSMVVSDTPHAIAALRTAGTLASVTAMLTGIVIILNAYQLMLLQGRIVIGNPKNTNEWQAQHGQSDSLRRKTP